MTVYVTNKTMRLKTVILNSIQDPYKSLWIPIFIGMTLIVSLFIFASSVSAQTCSTDCNACPSKTTCGSTTYDTCVDNFGNTVTTSCSSGATSFRCFASQNNNCASAPPGSFNYSCSACGVLSCNQVTTKTTCGSTTYDTCVDNFGNTVTTSCSSGATSFRCFASQNNNCASAPPGSFNYSCSACVSPPPPPATPVPTPIPTQPPPAPTQSPPQSTPIPTSPPGSTPTPSSPFSGGVYGGTLPGGGLIQNIFGKISPPGELLPFTQDKTGASGLSLFLSNLIKLIYAVAGIVLVFMFVWGAFQWLTSGGDKEKIAAARARIIHAIIGLMLFAIAFAVIGVLGTFTGFKFFEGRGGGSGPFCSQRTCIYNQAGTCYQGNCTNNSENCSDALDCGHVAGCPGGGTQVACPSGGGSPSILNCSYSEPNQLCSSGFQVCTGHTAQPSCFNSAPKDCFNPVVGCNFLADGSSTCTCSP